MPSVTNKIPFPVGRLPKSRHIFGYAELELINVISNCKTFYGTVILHSGHMPDIPKSCHSTVFGAPKLLLMQFFSKVNVKMC